MDIDADIKDVALTCFTCKDPLKWIGMYLNINIETGIEYVITNFINFGCRWTDYFQSRFL